jgi:hypothetical protein
MPEVPLSIAVSNRNGIGIGCEWESKEESPQGEVKTRTSNSEVPRVDTRPQRIAETAKSGKQQQAGEEPSPKTTSHGMKVP